MKRMRRAGIHLWLFLSLALLPGANPAHAAESDEMIDQLKEWLDEPLDLDTATEEELALLPWLDAGLAGAIVGLREHGGLSTLEDLLSIPGMDEARIAALTPFVSLHPRVHQAQLQFEDRSAWKPDAAARHRPRLLVQRDELRILAQAEPGPGTVSSAAASYRASWGRLIVGDFRPKLPWPLLLENPSLRSRTAGPSLNGATRLRPRLSFYGESWRGGGIELELESWHLLLARGAAEDTHAAPFLAFVGYRFAPSKGTELGLALRDQDEAGLFFALQREDLRARLEWVRDFSPGSSASDRVCAALQFREGPARWGVALTQAGPGDASGQDPITGQSTDREHRVIQTSGRLSGGAWTFAALARRRRRGKPGAVRVDERWQLRASGPLATTRLAVVLQVDEEQAGPSAFLLKLDWQERARGGALRRGLRFRQQRDDAGVATLLALSLEKGRAWFWRGVLALARGDRSSPWAVGVATAGLASTWLQPGASGLLCALARRDGRCRAGAWLRLVRDRSELLEWSAGLGFSLRLGGAD